jgi:hypothetical protein
VIGGLIGGHGHVVAHLGEETLQITHPSLFLSFVFFLDFQLDWGSSFLSRRKKKKMADEITPEKVLAFKKPCSGTFPVLSHRPFLTHAHPRSLHSKRHPPTRTPTHTHTYTHNPFIPIHIFVSLTSNVQNSCALSPQTCSALNSSSFLFEMLTVGKLYLRSLGFPTKKQKWRKQRKRQRKKKQTRK